MISKLIFNIFKSVGLFCLNWVFNFIDEDKDGVIEESEIKSLNKRIKEMMGAK